MFNDLFNKKRKEKKKTKSVSSAKRLDIPLDYARLAELARCGGIWFCDSEDIDTLSSSELEEQQHDKDAPIHLERRNEGRKEGRRERKIKAQDVKSLT